MEYSPSLADRLAASSAAGIDEVVRQLCEAIRPQGSTLIIARDHVINAGYRPPGGGPITLRLNGTDRTGYAVATRDDQGRVTVAVKLDDR
jgi:hypothetical protein